MKKFPIVTVATTLHLLVAMYYRYIGNFVIDKGILNDTPVQITWDRFWQTAPLEMLRESPIETIFYYHSQPPLFNLLGSVIGNIFYPFHLDALYTLNILLGCLIIYMTGIILEYLVPSGLIRSIVLIFVALYPALFLYETYILYDHLTAFWVVLCVFWALRFKSSQHTYYLYWFFVTLNLLVLTRSFFHPILLLVFLLILPFCIVSSRRWFLLICTSICTVTLIFLIKNLLVFGFFGLSSWQGMNIFRVASRPYTQSDLIELAENGVIDVVVAEVPHFQPPADYEAYGFNSTSQIAVLSQNDRNNINYIEISNTYGKNAIILLKLDPLEYLKTVVLNYFRYTRPSTRFHHLTYNAAEMTFHLSVYDIVIGQIISPDDWEIPIFSIILLLVLSSSIVYVVKKGRTSIQWWREFLNREFIMIILFIFICYGLSIGILLEHGESDRFKYLTEIPMIIFIVTWFCRVASTFVTAFAKS